MKIAEGIVAGKNVMHKETAQAAGMAGEEIGLIVITAANRGEKFWKWKIT